MIQISLNGDSRELQTNITLQQLVDELELSNKRYAIEVNEDIIPRSEHPEFSLSQGDKVEIVQAIGGG